MLAAHARDKGRLPYLAFNFMNAHPAPGDPAFIAPGFPR
jgi:hypothetical protein